MRRKVEAMEAHLAMDTEGRSQLEVYQNLCVEVGVVPGQSITQCKKVSSLLGGFGPLLSTSNRCVEVTAGANTSLYVGSEVHLHQPRQSN